MNNPTTILLSALIPVLTAPLSAAIIVGASSFGNGEAFWGNSATQTATFSGLTAAADHSYFLIGLSSRENRTFSDATIDLNDGNGAHSLTTLASSEAAGDFSVLLGFAWNNSLSAGNDIEVTFTNTGSGASFAVNLWQLTDSNAITVADTDAHATDTTTLDGVTANSFVLIQGVRGSGNAGNIGAYDNGTLGTPGSETSYDAGGFNVLTSQWLPGEADHTGDGITALYTLTGGNHDFAAVNLISVPEPGTFALMGLALGALFVVRRRG